MFKILKKTQFSEKVFEFRVHAPRMAKHAHAGQFLMVRINETGERVPFTFANWNPEEGWIEFIFMVVGKTTQCLSELNEGDEIQDITGPLGCPTEIEGDRVAVVGGGVGLAIAYPVARTLCEQGKKVSVIMGARNKDLLILFEQFASLPLENLFITTDDGSMGEKGVVTLPLRRLCETDSIDSCFCVGPVPMMKFSTLTCREFKIPIVASLNPIMACADAAASRWAAKPSSPASTARISMRTSSTGTTSPIARPATRPRKPLPSSIMRRTAHARSKVSPQYRSSPHPRERGARRGARS